MPIHFTIDTTIRCVYAVGTEPLTDADLLKYQVELSDHPDHGAGFDQLLDMTSISGVQVTAFGVREAGKLSREFSDYLRGTKCAVVATDGVAFGLARMFTAYAADVIYFKVFHEIEAAREWLTTGEAEA